MKKKGVELFRKCSPNTKKAVSNDETSNNHLSRSKSPNTQKTTLTIPKVPPLTMQLGTSQSQIHNDIREESERSSRTSVRLELAQLQQSDEDNQAFSALNMKEFKDGVMKLQTPGNQS